MGAKISLFVGIPKFILEKLHGIPKLILIKLYRIPKFVTYSALPSFSGQ
jgi:hypothetical protein